MGNWCIVVQGVGSHHNDNSADADFAAKAMVQLLKMKGHVISSATITYGGAQEIKPVPPEQPES